MNLSIRSQRKYKTWPSFHLVYEWEDIISDLMGINIEYESKLFDLLVRVERKLNLNIFAGLNKNKLELNFNLSAKMKSDYYNRSTVIPIIIDFYINESNLKNFYRSYNKNPFILISSAEVVEFLKTNNCPLKFYHFPLSLSDNYRVEDFNIFEKKYDLGLLGRQNPVLEEYLQKYLRTHSNITYIYRKLDKGRFLYFSNKGDFIGDVNTRDDYISLMQQCKIGFYSTPGIDGGESYTNGFNQVTPRFLELIACGCHIIARYKDNVDTDFYQISKFSPNIQNYNDFEKQIDKALLSQVDYEEYTKYLSNHYTSERVSLLKSIIDINF